MKNPKYLLLIICSLALACTNNSVEPEEIDREVSFANDVQPIFTAQCNSCHGNGQNGFNSGSYSGVMNSNSPNYGGPIVIPGDPENSPLIDKLEPNPQFGSRMPVGGALSSAQIATIREWIEQGALNN